MFVEDDARTLMPANDSLDTVARAWPKEGKLICFVSCFGQDPGCNHIIASAIKRSDTPAPLGGGVAGVDQSVGRTHASTHCKT